MASKIIGRATCPECDFIGAHVKQSEKCVYRYCPECGSQTIAKTERQQANMRKNMRPVLADASATAPGATASDTTATGSEAAPPATPAFTPKAAAVAKAVPVVAKRRGLFG